MTTIIILEKKKTLNYYIKLNIAFFNLGTIVYTQISANASRYSC